MIKHRHRGDHSVAREINSGEDEQDPGDCILDGSPGSILSCFYCFGSLALMLHVVGAFATIRASFDPWFCAGGSEAFAVHPPSLYFTHGTKSFWLDQGLVVSEHGFVPMGRRGSLGTEHGQCATLGHEEGGTRHPPGHPHSLAMAVNIGSRKSFSAFADFHLRSLQSVENGEQFFFVASVGLHQDSTLRLTVGLSNDITFTLLNVSDEATLHLGGNASFAPSNASSAKKWSVRKLWSSAPFPCGDAHRPQIGVESPPENQRHPRILEYLSVDVSGVQRLRLAVTSGVSKYDDSSHLVNSKPSQFKLLRGEGQEKNLDNKTGGFVLDRRAHSTRVLRAHGIWINPAIYHG